MVAAATQTWVVPRFPPKLELSTTWRRNTQIGKIFLLNRCYKKSIVSESLGYISYTELSNLKTQEANHVRYHRSYPIQANISPV